MPDVRVPLVLLLAAAGACGAFAAPRSAYVREVRYVVESVTEDGPERDPRSLFMIYVGNADTERLDRAASRSGIVRTTCLVHPVQGLPGAAASVRGRWYVEQTDTTRWLSRRGPLLDPAVWREIPVLARHVLLALGPDDDDLILLSWNEAAGSLSVYYAPRLQEDRAFFERKLDVLRRYMEEHGRETDVPFDRVQPGAAPRDARGYPSAYILPAGPGSWRGGSCSSTGRG